MNLDEVDQVVRASLLAHAENAPSGADTLDAVRSRSRRIQVRQRTGLACTAVVVGVALAVGTPYALSSLRHPASSQPGANGQSPLQVVTTASPSTSPSATPEHASRVALGAAAFTPVTFPFTPTFTPAGLPAPTEGRSAGVVRLVYSVSPTSVKGIIAEVSAERPDVAFTATTTSQITVSGHPATLSVGTSQGESAVQIVWKVPATWVSVLAGGLSVNDVERYARGLTEKPRTPTPLPFTIALAPTGYQVDFQEIHPEYSPTQFYFNLSSPGQLNNQSSHDMVGVVSSPDTVSQATGRSIQVGDYPAKINTDSDGIVTIYVLRPGFAYAVHEFQDGPLSQTDLIRFAAGIGPR